MVLEEGRRRWRSPSLPRSGFDSCERERYCRFPRRRRGRWCRRPSESDPRGASPKRTRNPWYAPPSLVSTRTKWYRQDRSGLLRKRKDVPMFMARSSDHMQLQQLCSCQAREPYTPHVSDLPSAQKSAKDPVDGSKLAPCLHTSRPSPSTCSSTSMYFW